MNTSRYCVFFNAKKNGMQPDDLRGQPLTMEEHAHFFCCPEAEVGILTHQVHGTEGIKVTPAELIKLVPSLTHDADYLITDLSGVMIGILTADCLPILIVDPAVGAIAAVHSGWRGAAGSIVRKVIQEMQEHYASRPADLEIYFGPSARSCCYQVSPGFRNEFKDLAIGHAAFSVKDGVEFFDNVFYTKLLLQALGCDPARMMLSSAVCTICSDEYHSHRREPSNKARQLSVVCKHAA